MFPDLNTSEYHSPYILPHFLANTITYSKNSLNFLIVLHFNKFFQEDLCKVCNAKKHYY